MEAVASTFFLWPYPSGPATEAVTGSKYEAVGCLALCERMREEAVNERRLLGLLSRQGQPGIMCRQSKR